MFVSILLICSVLASTPVATGGERVRGKNMTYAWVRRHGREVNSTKYVSNSVWDDEGYLKCAEDCQNDEEGRTECMFEKCPQYDYCYSNPRDLALEGDCSKAFEGNDEMIKACKEAGFQEYYEDTCYTYSAPTECSTAQTEYEEAKEKREKNCLADVDVDDLHSYQKKCAARCSSQYDAPDAISNCASTCTKYSKCPSSNSDYKDECIKEGEEECKGEDDEGACKKQVERECKRQANVLCPKFPVWAIVLIVVLAVVIIAAVVVVIIVVLKCRKPKVASSDSTPSEN